MTNGPTRALLGALALTTVVGCGGSTEFEITRTFQVQGTGTVSASEDVSLRDVAGEAWDQRDKIDDLKVKSAVATVTAVAAPPNTALTGALAGSVSRGSGASLETAEVVNATAAIAVGTTVVGENLGEASGIVKRALEGDGQLSVDVVAEIPSGTTADFTVEVVMRVEAEWSLF
jgi:hypothetical protein